MHLNCRNNYCWTSQRFPFFLQNLMFWRKQLTGLHIFFAIVANVVNASEQLGPKITLVLITPPHLVLITLPHCVLITLPHCVLITLPYCVFFTLPLLVSITLPHFLVFITLPLLVFVTLPHLVLKTLPHLVFFTPTHFFISEQDKILLSYAQWQRFST